MAEESSSPLLLFVIQLSEDEDLRAEFERDPDAVIEASDLSPEAKAAFKSREHDTVHAHIQTELGRDPGPIPMTFWVTGG
jgi:hypothetical protein